MNEETKKGVCQPLRVECPRGFLRSFACGDERGPLVARNGRFVNTDQFPLPAHWQLFLARTSPLTKSARASSNPINTLLNHLYAILETEVSLAVPAMGMDSGMGILHADLKGRDSFVFDLIEPLWPVVDGYLLTLLGERTFPVAEFFETRQGVCRLMPPMAKVLAGIAPQLTTLVAPLVEQVAQRLAKGQGTAAQPLRVPTLLTQTNRSAGRDAVRTNPRSTTKQKPLDAPAACRECGVLLAVQNRQYCDDCRPEVEQAEVADFSAAGRAKLAALRAAGKDPSRGGEAAKKRAAALRPRAAERAAWEAEQGKVEVDESFQERDLASYPTPFALEDHRSNGLVSAVLLPHPTGTEAAPPPSLGVVLSIDWCLTVLLLRPRCTIRIFDNHAIVHRGPHRA